MQDSLTCVCDAIYLLSSAYKQEQKGKKEAAADRKKKQQAATATLSSPNDSTTPVGSQPPNVTDSLRASTDTNTEQPMDIGSNIG